MDTCISGYIPVIDVFAGPGGLGEGFSAFRQGSEHPFRIRLSVEKDHRAWETLSLRAFFRQFGYAGSPVPDDYYLHVCSPNELTREELFSRYPSQSAAALEEAWNAELGAPKTEEALHGRIKRALGGHDAWVLIGGPPCQAYSLVGRSRNARNPEFEDDQRHFLYREYLNILAEHWPPLFIMENVKGILSARARGKDIFPAIRRDLASPGAAVGGSSVHTYRLFSLTCQRSEDELRPADFVVRSEECGIPQSRHRVILLGIRDDFAQGEILNETLPVIKEPCPIESVLTLPRIRSGLSRSASCSDSWENWRRCLLDAADSPWLSELDKPVRRRIRQVIAALGRQQRELPKRSMGRGRKPAVEPDWFWDDRLEAALNHEARFHREDDLHRYLFASCYAEIIGRAPSLREFPAGLLPDHENALEAAGGVGGHFADRFRVQCKGRPATTITCHMSKDGHYYIHPDPSQCRSLTVREAARIQTFPDNYFFCGPRTAQYLQVGNAVPPLLAKQIAGIVWRILSK